MSTYAIIHPIIVRTYGASPTTKAMIEHLASKIDRGDEGHYDSREDMIVSVCWDWMTGGTTAAAVGAEIEAALDERRNHSPGGPS